MLADMLADYIDGDMIIHAGDDDIGVARRGTHKCVEGRLDEPQVLVQDTLDGATAVDDIAANAPSEHDVRVCLHKNFEVE